MDASCGNAAISRYSAAYSQHSVMSMNWDNLRVFLAAVYATARVRVFVDAIAEAFRQMRKPVIAC